MMAKTLGFRSWLPIRSQLQCLVFEFNASRMQRATISTLQEQHLTVEAEISNLEKKLREFKRSVPIEEASTPPSSWYTDPAFAEFEMDHVFSRGWQAVGHIGQVEKPGDFFTGRLASESANHAMWCVKMKRDKCKPSTMFVAIMQQRLRLALVAHILSFVLTMDGHMD